MKIQDFASRQIKQFPIDCTPLMKTIFQKDIMWFFIRRTETKDRGIYPLDKQINRITISMLSMSALFFSNLSMFKYIREMVCYCQMMEWGKRMKEIRLSSD